MPDPELRAHPDFLEGVRLFNSGQWWHAHEAWEGVWLSASGQDRAFLQALILLAAALHKRWAHGSLTHRNYHKAAAYLEALPDQLHGVNLRRLQAEVWAGLSGPAAAPQIEVQAG